MWLCFLCVGDDILFGFHAERNIVKCNEILVLCISADGKIHLRDVTCLVLQMLLFKF